MADAYCGPSNALQNLQKHSSVDRTLQQDRLTQRTSPLEGFRSQDPNAGLLDPEFEAFQASQPGPLGFAEPPPPAFQSFNQRGKQPAFGGMQNGSNWASDFQRLQVSSPGPQMQHSPSPAQFRSSPAVVSQSVSPAPAQSSYVPRYTQPQYGGLGGHNGFAGMSQGYMQQQPMQSQAPAQTHQEVDMFDEAAFERAFDMAKEQILAEEAISSVQDAKLAGQIPQTRRMDPYPHLSLLRMVMFSELMEPTEENMHKFARYFSLLEKHNPEQIDSTQYSLFAPMLDILRTEETLHFSDRYKLASRANELHKRWNEVNRDPVPANISERIEKAVAYYARSSRHLPYALYTMDQAPARTVTDDEMLHDVQQQASTVTEHNVVERVFDTMTAQHLDPINKLHDAQQSVVDLESEILNEGVPQDIVQSVREHGPQDAHLRLWGTAYRAAFEPEMVEQREQMEQHDQELLDQMQMEEAIQTLPDQALQEEQQEDPLQHDENDDLARTAGELLDKVRDNQSTKFQNSTFLDLMRRLRDREVRVEGDKMVETNLSLLDGSVDDGFAFITPISRPLTDGVAPAQSFSRDVPQQELRDGEDVVRMLDEPLTLDQGNTPFRPPAGPDEDLSQGLRFPGQP
ncbi:Hypothetical protein D9617_21g097560 [Elsinoe fawcettii]|nr:Hypothetical protein D9617_21g097560 [Elsinoe fawcettii]